MKGVLKGLLASLKNGDENVKASLEAMGKSGYIVKGKDLNAPDIQAKAVKLETFMKSLDALPSNAPQKMMLGLPPLTGKDSLQAATRTFNRIQSAGELRDYAGSGYRQGAGDRPAPARSPQRPLPEALKSMLPGSKPAIMPQRSLPSTMGSIGLRPTTRIYDWNPDMKIARRLGVDIRYFSSTNEIYCPQLRISSSGILYERDPRTVRAARAAGFSGGEASGGSVSGSSESSGSASSSGNSASTSGSSTSGSSSGSSSAKGGVIK
jgi:hypothetical protein